ncbi:MAG TPA: ribosomal L7Ae/L30e/S12e/Gadd45 family protein [Syntrophomonadaceae bacterium]|nr:ribosomal L7Ae/L30e/S12e/Gadd45 family protein [Syntrophomonadaceae bacterium]
MQKVYSMLGFAQKAGKISTGTLATKSSLIGRKAYLLLMSNDIADNSKEILVKTCEKFNIPWITLGDKYELGTSVGKAYRVAVTINDKKMATAIIGSLHETGDNKETMGVVQWPK